MQNQKLQSPRSRRMCIVKQLEWESRSSELLLKGSFQSNPKLICCLSREHKKKGTKAFQLINKKKLEEKLIQQRKEEKAKAKSYSIATHCLLPSTTFDMKDIEELLMSIPKESVWSVNSFVMTTRRTKRSIRPRSLTRAITRLLISSLRDYRYAIERPFEIVVCIGQWQHSVQSLCRCPVPPRTGQSAYAHSNHLWSL